MHLDQHALSGRTVLLTGASRGIGAVTAEHLAAAGATVIAQYRTHRPGAEAAVAGVPECDRLVLQGELSTAAGARELWRDAVAWGRRIDVLVLNAAVIPAAPIDGPDDVWDAAWQEALQVNVIGAGALMREAVRYFVANGGGSVIVLSSWAAEQGSRIPDLTTYAASKAAIRNLAQTFARTYARSGLRVYVLAPGVVNTGMSLVGMDEQAQQGVAAGLAMGEYVEASEVAALIAFLATGAVPSLTGATVDINGASYIR